MNGLGWEEAKSLGSLDHMASKEYPPQRATLVPDLALSLGLTLKIICGFMEETQMAQ